VIEHPYIDPDDTLSKETRQMMADNFQPTSASAKQLEALNQLVDAIFNPHSDIIRRLRTIRNAMSLCDPEPLYDIETIDKAIAALEKAR
jgi:hypothetical protein